MENNKSKKNRFKAAIAAMTLGMATLSNGCAAPIQSNQSIESEKKEDNVETVKKILETCETMASSDESTLQTTLEKIEAAIRQDDSKNYTKWTDPNGELHAENKRTQQDALDLIETFLKEDIEEKDNEYFCNYIYDKDKDNEFIRFGGKIMVANFKNYLVYMARNAINELLRKYGFDFTIDYIDPIEYSYPMNPELLSLDYYTIICKVLNNDYEQISRNKLSAGEQDIIYIAENLLNGIVKSDTFEELARGGINIISLQEAVSNDNFLNSILEDVNIYQQESIR